MRKGIEKSWEPHERLPACSLKTLLTRFLDLTTPPSRQLLTLLASFCDDKEDEDRMYLLANVSMCLASKCISLHLTLNSSVINKSGRNKREPVCNTVVYSKVHVLIIEVRDQSHRLTLLPLVEVINSMKVTRVCD